MLAKDTITAERFSSAPPKRKLTAFNHLLLLFNKRHYFNLKIILLLICSIAISHTAMASDKNYRLPSNINPSSQYVELTLLDPEKDTLGLCKSFSEFLLPYQNVLRK